MRRWCFIFLIGRRKGEDRWLVEQKKDLETGQDPEVVDEDIQQDRITRRVIVRVPDLADTTTIVKDTHLVMIEIIAVGVINRIVFCYYIFCIVSVFTV